MNNTTSYLYKYILLIRKYLYFTKISFRHCLSERATTLGWLGFYALILYIFSRLWLVAFENSSLPDTNSNDLLWYLAMTEWIVMSTPHLHLDLEHAIQTGDFAYQLPRPVSYLGIKIFEGIGILLFRLCVIGAGGFLITWVFAGSLPTYPISLIWILPFGLLSGLVLILIEVGVGLTAFWLTQAWPAAWVVQKLLFVLGGMIIPLSLYPNWLFSLVWFTPFPALLYFPVHSAMKGNAQNLGLAAVLLLSWGFAVFCLLLLLYKKSVEKINLYGE